MIYADHVQTKALFSGLYKSVLCKLGYNYQVYYRSMSQSLTNSGAHTTGKTLLQDQGLITNTFEQLCLETLFSYIDVRVEGRFRCGIQFGDSQRKNAEGGSWALIFNCGWLEWQGNCRCFVGVGVQRHLVCSIRNLLVLCLLETLSQ
jgi:hypothetical protein